MMQWLNYHHLYYFWTIAEEGSISKAAARLRLGQPTLSAQLKQFEESLGVKLFERQHKKLTLTEHGEVAREYARTIFRTGLEMMEALNDRLQPARPTLSVGSLDSVPKHAVAQLVQRAQKLMPCQITLREGTSAELCHELAAHRVDLLLSNFLPTGQEARGFHHRLLARNPVSVFGAAQFRALRKGFPDSIRAQPMILPTYDSKLRYDLEAWAKHRGVSFLVAVESQDISMKKLLAADGVGLIATATHAVTRQVQDGELTELGQLDGVTEDLYLISANRKIQNPLAARLMREFSV